MNRFRSISSKLKSLLLILILATGQVVTATGPFINKSVASAAPAPQINYNNFEGEIAQQNSDNWTNGNISGYKEGDTVRFRVDLDSDAGTLTGHLKIGFTSDPSCRFFKYLAPTAIALDFNRATNAIDSGSGFTATYNSLSQIGSDAVADFTLGSTAAKQVRLNFTLQLDDNAAACGTGSSQHVQTASATGDIKSSGNKALPIPSTAVAPVTDITVAKTGTPSASLGSTVSYAITVNNLDLTPAAGVIVEDIVPAGIVPTTVTYDVDPLSVGGTGSCTVSSQTVTCNIGTLGGNDSNTTAPEADVALITVNGTVSQSTSLCSTTLINNVSVSTTTLESNYNNNSAQASTIISSCPGTITLIKNVIKDSGGTAGVNDFGLTIGGVAVTSGQTQTLAPNSYAINEVGLAGYSFVDITGTGCPATLGGSVTLTNGQNITCTITNNDQPGTLTVNKVVINDNGGNAQASDFSFTKTADATNYNFVNGATTLLGSKPFTVNAGTYSAVENSFAGYTMTGNTCTNVVVANGGTASCTITNDDNAPGLTLVKLLGEMYGSNAVVGDWNLTATGALDPSTDLSGATGTAGATSGSDFKADTYTLGETGLTGFTASWICQGGNNLISLTIAISLGQSVTCTVTNTAIQPRLTVTKVVNNDNGGIKVITDFPLSVNGTPVTSGVQTGFNVGTYTVAETSDAGYTAVISGDCNPTTGSVTLALADVKACTITNNDIAPSLTLVKVVDNQNGGTAEASAWTLTADGPTGFSGSGPSVSNGDSFDAGTYTLTETDGPSGYTASDWDCEGGTQDGNSITVALGDDVTCTITNNDNAPTLTVKKIVINDNGGNATVSDFDITNNGTGLTFDAGATVGTTTTYTATPTIISNTDYKLSEIDFAGYAEGTWTCTDETNGTIRDVTVNLNEGENVTCTITNDDQQSYIIVNKTVDNLNGGSANPNDFNLTVNGNAVFDELAYPVNPGTYTVGETNLPGYSQGEWGQDCNAAGSVTVALGETKTCTITNDDNAAQLTLVKSNNRPNSTIVGDSVTYTLVASLDANGGALFGTTVTDLPPAGFVYVLGSWTAVSSIRGNLRTLGVTTQPPYGSPGTWQLGDLLPGEIVTLTYLAKIASSVSDGAYSDIAFAQGDACGEESQNCDEDGMVVYSNVHRASSPFVDTKVTVSSPKVLGANILVNTGSPLAWAYALTATMLMAAGIATTRRRNTVKGGAK